MTASLCAACRVSVRLSILLFMIILSFEAAAARVEAPTEECDRLAQPPRTQLGTISARTDGIAPDLINGEAALAACLRAEAAYPDEARFRVWHALALRRLGRIPEGLRLLIDSFETWLK